MNEQDKKLLQEVNTRLKKVEQYTTSIGGSLEFKNLIQEYAKNLAKVTDIEIDGALNHDGSTIGFFGTTPTTQQSSIADPSGGATIDSQARTAINSILDVLDNFGLTA